MTDRGVIYYAVGKTCLQQAKLSAASLHEHTDVGVTLCTDCTVDSPHFDEVVQVDTAEYPIYDRKNYFMKFPYKRTLHLDTDTYVTGDITPIFELLDRFEVAAAFNESRDTAAPHTKFETVNIDAPDSFPEYQCGVIAYRDTDAVKRLFDNWRSRHKAYRDEHLGDQPLFREAVYNSDVSLGTLPTEYNTLVNFGGYLHGKVRLLHYAGTNIGKLSAGTPNSEALQTVAAKLNRDVPQNRVFFCDSRGRLRVVPTRMTPTLGHRAVELIRTEGVAYTAKRALQKAWQNIT